MSLTSVITVHVSVTTVHIIVSVTTVHIIVSVTRCVDFIGIWRGTEAQFLNFVSDINRLTAPFGIKFDGAQYGKSVNFLDVNIYLDSNNIPQYS